MEISLIAALDDSTGFINGKIFPLAIEALKPVNIDNTVNGFKLSRLRSRGYLSSRENIVLKVTFDSKSCRIPFEHCPGSCSDCVYNPIPHLLDPHSDEHSRQFVITGRDTINTLLDTIAMLAIANKGSLL
jgi:hypothetical protein